MLAFVGIVLLLFGAILICLECGWRLRRRHLAHETPYSEAGLSALAGAVFTLMGLLIAFTFNGAAARFEARRALIVQEANAIDTAYLRIDLLPQDAQPALRQDFRDYLEARLGYFASVGRDTAAASQAALRGRELQEKIWSEAVAASARQSSAAVTTLVIGSLNTMIDITTNRAMALETHPPPAIYIVLASFVMASSVLAGYAMAKAGKRNRTHMLIFAGTIALAIYLILDMDYPRIGLIRIDSADQFMVGLRGRMK